MNNSSISLSFYQWVTILFYCWILIEGCLRKWLLPGLATPMFFVKYLLLIGAFFFFIMKRTRINNRTYPFLGVLVFFVAYCLIEVVNLDVTRNPQVWLIGCVLHTGFIPLIFILPKVIQTKQHINNLLQTIYHIALAVFILGIVQYFSPADSIINKYVNDDMSIAMVGDHVRITTVFSYIAGHTSFLCFVLPFMLVQLFNTTSINFKSIYRTAVFLLGIINLLMTGSRGAVGVFIITALLIFIVLAVSMPAKKVAIYCLNFLLLSMLGYFALLQTETGSTAFNSFAERVEGNNDIEGRVSDSFDPFKFLDTAGLIGFGIGTTYAANEPLLSGRYLMPGFWEEESERIVLELGLIGFTITVVLRILIFIFAVKSFKTLSDPIIKQLVLVILTLQLPTILFINQVTFNWLENIFYWTGVGVLVALNQINRYEKQAAPDSGLAFR